MPRPPDYNEAHTHYDTAGRYIGTGGLYRTSHWLYTGRYIGHHTGRLPVRYLGHHTGRIKERYIGHYTGPIMRRYV